MVYEDYDRFNDSTCISALPIRSPRSSAQKMLPQWNVNKLPPKDENKNKIYLWPSIKEKSLTSGAFGPESRYIFIRHLYPEMGEKQIYLTSGKTHLKLESENCEE